MLIASERRELRKVIIKLLKFSPVVRLIFVDHRQFEKSVHEVILESSGHIDWIDAMLNAQLRKPITGQPAIHYSSRPIQRKYWNPLSGPHRVLSPCESQYHSQLISSRSKWWPPQPFMISWRVQQFMASHTSQEPHLNSQRLPGWRSWWPAFPWPSTWSQALTRNGRSRQCQRPLRPTPSVS